MNCTKLCLSIPVHLRPAPVHGGHNHNKQGSFVFFFAPDQHELA